MKIAICISGIARPNSIRNVELVKQSFGGDVFFATWESTVNEHSAKFECDLYPEPKINYNPWTDKNCVCMHYKYHGYKNKFLAGEYSTNSNGREMDSLAHHNIFATRTFHGLKRGAAIQFFFNLILFKNGIYQVDLG